MVLYSIFVDSLITHRNPLSTPMGEEEKMKIFFNDLFFYVLRSDKISDPAKKHQNPSSIPPGFLPHWTHWTAASHQKKPGKHIDTYPCAHHTCNRRVPSYPHLLQHSQALLSFPLPHRQSDPYNIPGLRPPIHGCWNLPGQNYATDPHGRDKSWSRANGNPPVKNTNAHLR